MLELSPVNFFDESIARRRLEGGDLVAVERLKSGGQIAADGAPPATDVRFFDFRARLVGQKGLQELQDRRVVEDLRADAPAATPGRGDDHRHAVSQPNRTLACLAGRRSLLILVQLDVFDADVDPCCDPSGLGPAGMRCDKRRDVIEVTVILVVGHEEDGLFPDLRIAGQNVQHFRDVPRAVPGRRRVVGKCLGTDKPRHRRQAAFGHILAEAMQHVALRHFQSAFHFAVVIGDLGELAVKGIADIRGKGPRMKVLFTRRKPVKPILRPFQPFCLITFECGREMGDPFFQLGLPFGRAGLSDLLLQSIDLARKFPQLFVSIRSVRSGQPHLILIEVFERIVTEVRQPGVFALAESGFESQFVLVNLPRDAVVLQSFGEGRPTRPTTVIDVLIANVGRRIGSLPLANRPGPQVETIGSRRGQGRAEMLVADRKRIRQGVVKGEDPPGCNIPASTASPRTRGVPTVSPITTGRDDRDFERRPGRPGRAAGFPSTSTCCS